MPPGSSGGVEAEPGLVG
jgi:hypothetical protein